MDEEDLNGMVKRDVTTTLKGGKNKSTHGVVTEINNSSKDEAFRTDRINIERDYQE